MFVFMSLALVKRYVELMQAYTEGNIYKTNGRGYCPNDLEIIASFGVVSGYLSVLIITLYIQDAQAAIFYHQPRLIWLICPTFLFWISRMWLLAHRGKMKSDPVVFVLKDKLSIVISISFAVIFFMAS